MQMHHHPAFGAARPPRTNNKGRSTLHRTAALSTHKHHASDSDTDRAADAIYRRLCAEFGFLGYALNRGSVAGQFVVTRFGLERDLRNLHAAVEFFRELGGQP